MKNIVLLFTFLFLVGCAADDESCQTCESETPAGTISVEYCQEGTDVVSNTSGVLSTIPNTTVEEVVASQVAIGLNCN